MTVSEEMSGWTVVIAHGPVYVQRRKPSHRDKQLRRVRTQINRAQRRGIRNGKERPLEIVVKPFMAWMREWHGEQ